MPGITTMLLVGAGLGLAGSYMSGQAQKKAAKRQSEAIEKANQQNIAAHTMTPEEKAAYFSTGVSKINRGYDTAMRGTSSALAARGVGGNALASPISNIGRGRAASIGDLWGNIVSTAASMKSSTPVLQPAPSAPSTSEAFFSNLGPLMGNVGAYGLGYGTEKYLDKYFKKPGSAIG